MTEVLSRFARTVQRYLGDGSKAPVFEAEPPAASTDRWDMWVVPNSPYRSRLAYVARIKEPSWTEPHHLLSIHEVIDLEFWIAYYAMLEDFYDVIPIASAPPHPHFASTSVCIDGYARRQVGDTLEALAPWYPYRPPQDQKEADDLWLATKSIGVIYTQALSTLNPLGGYGGFLWHFDWRVCTTCRNTANKDGDLISWCPRCERWYCLECKPPGADCCHECSVVTV